MKCFKLLFALLLLFNMVPKNVNAQDSLQLTIYFPYNKSTLTTIAKQQLKAISDIDTNSYKLTKIAIAAHCDQIGGFLYNDILSKQRGLSVKSFLIDSFLINENKITTSFFGKRNLVTQDTFEISRQKNRRVEIVAFFDRKILTTIKETPIIENKKEEIIEAYNEPNIPITFASKILDSTFKAGDTVRLNNILFYPGRHKFLAISNTQLTELFNAMKDIQTLEIEIHGHICCNLSKDDALDYETGKFDLSIQRAKAVFDYLVGKGIHPKRMKFKGFGHQFPLNEEKTTYEMQQNRRVEIKVISK